MCVAENTGHAGGVTDPLFIEHLLSAELPQKIQPRTAQSPAVVGLMFFDREAEVTENHKGPRVGK